MNFVTSKYIQICDWCLIEYEYSTMSPKNLNYLTSEIGTYKITNNISNEYQFVNEVGSDEEVNNTNRLDWTLLPVSSNKNLWADYNITDNRIIIKNSSSLFTGNKVYYDTIRIHVLSGYNLEGSDGFILDVSWLEKSNKKCRISSISYLKNTSHMKFTFNPNPILLGERSYDKYIDVIVPSHYEYVNKIGVLDDFKINYSHPQVLGNPNPGGFVKDSLIYISLHEINFKETINDINYYLVKQTFDASILPTDNYSYLSCVIKESNIGDVYEFYPLWQNEFIDDYISLLNENGKWSVVHNIKVIEQIGSKRITTTDISMPQLSDFNKPIFFRPVIYNAGIAFAFSIEYIMRLVNMNSGEQVLRKTNITSYSPKKYGLNLSQIKIDSGIQPMKVYNKIEKTNIITPQNLIQSNNMFTTKYITNYINQNNIVVNSNDSNTDIIDNIIYGQGKCIIYLSPFDNVFKFVIQQLTKDGLIPVNLIGLELFLEFIEDNGQHIIINPELNKESSTFESGQIVFNILEEQAVKILKIKKDKSFYIINNQDKGSLKTVLYKGQFKKFENNIEEIEIDKVKPLKLKIKEMKNEYENLVEINIKLQDELNIQIESNNTLKTQLENKIKEYEDLINNMKLKEKEKFNKQKYEINKTSIDSVMMKDIISPQLPIEIKKEKTKDLPIKVPIVFNPIQFISPVSENINMKSRSDSDKERNNNQKRRN